MKNLITALFLVAFAFAATAQNSTTESEFSNPTFFVGSVVVDLDASIDFYTNVIGMTKTGSFSVPVEKAKELGLSDKYTLDVAVLKLENSDKANEWKLMSLRKKPGHKKPKWIHDDTGMQYITIFVKHLNPIIERVKKHNVKILSQTPSQLGENKYFILVQDPDGTFIELIGPK
jgi:catechol 2,3-dioxygenase-like lactoylglutathione lyase family enzyme